MPTVQEIAASLQQGAPKTFALVQDGTIVLTGTRSREGIWAYTRDPQSAAGEHLVVTSSTVQRMPAATLGERLRQQGGQ
jgi:hypothetical protein